MFRRGKHARPHGRSIYGRTALAGLTAFMMLTATVALADNLQSDLNTTTGGQQKTVDRGTLLASTAYTQDVFLFVDETSSQGNNPTYPFTVSLDTGNLGATFSGVTITGAGAINGQTGQVAWTTPAAQATAQNYEITVTFLANTEINESPATVNIQFTIAGAPSDTSAPQGATITIDDGADWTNNSGGNVTVDISATDNVGVASYRLAETQAGLAAATPVAVTPAEAIFSRTNVGFTLTGAEGPSKSVWLRVCDGASVPNCADASDAIGWDKTTPTVVYTSASPAPNAAGWNNTNVVATFTATDNLSGFAPGGALTTTGTATTSGEGTAITVGSPAFTDIAGNTVAAGSATSAAFKIDKTRPTVAVTGVSNGATYILGSVPSAGCSTVDDLSKVKATATVNVTGGTVNGVGSFTATCTGGLDNADNSQAAPVSASYLVIYDPAGISGILQPINLDNTSLFSRGKAVPVKFRLAGDEPNGFDYSGWTLQRIKVSCADFDQEDSAIEAVAENPSNAFRYDAGADQYINNASFKDQAAGTCWKVRVTLDSGQTMESAIFRLQK